MAVSGSTTGRRGPSSGVGPTRDAAEQVTQAAGDAIDKVGGQAKQTATTQKDRIAGGLNATAKAIRQTGSSLKQEQPMVADYAEKAAARVDRVSGYLREHDIDEVVTDVQDYARKNKAAFIAGTLLLGFMTARLVKTAGRRQQLAQSPISSPARPVGVSSTRYVPMGNSAMEVNAEDSYPLDEEPFATGAGVTSRTRANGH